MLVGRRETEKVGYFTHDLKANVVQVINEKRSKAVSVRKRIQNSVIMN